MCIDLVHLAFAGIEIQSDLHDFAVLWHQQCAKEMPQMASAFLSQTERLYNMDAVDKSHPQHGKVADLLASADVIFTNNWVMGQCRAYGKASLNGEIAALLHEHLNDNACVISTVAIDHVDSHVQTRSDGMSLPGSLHVARAFYFPPESMNFTAGACHGYVCARRR